MTARRLADAQAEFDPDHVWLNTATYGLPPVTAWDELQAALAAWQHGRQSWEPWGETTGRARAAFARLVGADPSRVATGSTVSALVGSSSTRR